MKKILFFFGLLCISCGDKEVLCPTIALECPTDETQCASVDEQDGCYEITQGSDECKQTIYCLPASTDQLEYPLCKRAQKWNRSEEKACGFLFQ